MSCGRLSPMWRVVVPVALALASLQAGAVDADDMSRELTRLHSSAAQRDFVYWLPAQAIATLMPEANPSERDMIAKMLTGYELFMVARVRIDAAGQAVPLASGLPNDHVRLRLADGHVVLPEQDDDLPPVVRRIAIAFRPLFERQPGFGKAMHAVLFRLDDAANAPRIDSPKASTLTLLVDDVPLVWHLPLAGAVPPSVDPASGEKFPGGYFFNPYTGAPLKRE